MNTHLYRLAFILVAWLFVANNALAQAKFVPLSPSIPIVGKNWYQGDMSALLNALLGISVAVAAVLAVIMVAIGGFKYMTTDSVFAISGAKEQISNAIIGLLIVLASILLLKTINPGLVNLDLFKAVGSSSNTTTSSNTSFSASNSSQTTASSQTTSSSQPSTNGDNCGDGAWYNPFYLTCEVGTAVADGVSSGASWIWGGVTSGASYIWNKVWGE